MKLDEVTFDQIENQLKVVAGRAAMDMDDGGGCDAGCSNGGGCDAGCSNGGGCDAGCS